MQPVLARASLSLGDLRSSAHARPELCSVQKSRPWCAHGSMGGMRPELACGEAGECVMNELREQAPPRMRWRWRVRRAESEKYSAGPPLHQFDT